MAIVTTAEPSRRVVLIGASNVTMSFRAILTTLGQMWSEPLEVVTALGHGRSFGMRSFVIARSLPGILTCGLWEALDRQSSLPTHALITDIGNDLLYHVPVPQLVEWVEQALERLSHFQAKIVLVRLPTAGLERLSSARFYFFRSLFMPLCRLSRDELVRRAIELDERIAVVGRQYGATLVSPRAEWYGFDPMHIRRSQRLDAWRELLGHLHDEPVTWPESPQVMPRVPRWELLTPHERRLFGIVQHQVQPALRLNDGTRVSLY
jgi:hypothetical protein